MKRIAEALFILSLWIAFISLLAFVVAGTMLSIASGDGVIRDAPLLSYIALAFLFSIFLGIFSSGLASFAEKRAASSARPKPMIRIQPMDKAPGWNEAVLRWFLKGPEKRVMTDDFKQGFAARAQVPPPKRRK